MTTPCPNLQNQRVLETGEGSGEGSGEACFLPATPDPTLDPTPVSLEKDETGMEVVKKKKPRKSAAQRKTAKAVELEEERRDALQQYSWQSSRQLRLWGFLLASCSARRS